MNATSWIWGEEVGLSSTELKMLYEKNLVPIKLLLALHRRGFFITKNGAGAPKTVERVVAGLVRISRHKACTNSFRKEAHDLARSLWLTQTRREPFEAFASRVKHSSLDLFTGAPYPVEEEKQRPSGQADQSHRVGGETSKQLKDAWVKPEKACVRHSNLTPHKMGQVYDRVHRARHLDLDQIVADRIAEFNRFGR